MKPFELIAQDAGLDEEQPAHLRLLLSSEPGVAALYQRVEYLEEMDAQYKKLESEYFLQSCALQVSHDQTRHAERCAEIANEKFERVVELHSRDWRDRPTPEDEDIDAAHPVNSDRHETYAKAMRLVGDRHSKSSLVAMVNWLLTRVEDLEAKQQTNDV
jgi:hypothetical protein